MYIAIFTSKADTAALRSETQPQHDAYWEEHLGRVKLAGPILSDDGATRLGQILLLDVDDRVTAEKIATEDPFVKAGLFSSWSIRRLRVSVESGQPVRNL